MPNSRPIFSHNNEQQRISLRCPVSIPNASGFLWNNKMMLQMNCRGYANAQHMSPEPAKYSYAQSLEAKTFMQPEHHYHSSHPGRFFFIKINGKTLFSLPYEPMRVPHTEYEFSQGKNDIAWLIKHADIEFKLTVSLAQDHALEQWHLQVTSHCSDIVTIDIYPCFSIGYASWMNQSAAFNKDINGVLAKYITPYQKVEDYDKNKELLDHTVLLADSLVVSYDTCIKEFEGEGGLHQPDAIAQNTLNNSVALYQTPVAVLQHSVTLESGQSEGYNWLFGATHSEASAMSLKQSYFKDSKSPSRFVVTDAVDTPKYKIATANTDFDSFVNTWLPRQIQYHCQANRLTRDPQTRNYLQDHMVEVLTDSKAAKQNFLFALSQQSETGAMPDGILLHPDAELKYINQIPHSDHNVWLFIYLDTYLQHSADLSILEEKVAFADDALACSVFEHLERAAQYLYKQIDHRSLSFIEQGDWCDPMNMVGKDGKGVSFWLTMASAYAFSIFAQVCETTQRSEHATKWKRRQYQLNDATNKLGWDGNWYARGICDNGRVFGIKADTEGQIYVNPQAWSMLCKAASLDKQQKLIQAVDDKLDTPFGVAMLAPAYTQMDEDIGRLTQKFPGTAENGSIYNHAACFYAFALLKSGYADKGFDVLNKMLVTNKDVLIRQQLPNFVPNYYRGAYYQHSEVAGRSSHLFNTGTCSWYYRCVVECIFGISIIANGLRLSPCIAPSLGNSSIEFSEFQSDIKIEYILKHHDIDMQIIAHNLHVNLNVNGSTIEGFEANKQYKIQLLIPSTKACNE